MQEWDDREIIEGSKIQGKEEIAFNQLVVKYQERLYWHIRKIVINHDDTDDVLDDSLSTVKMSELVLSSSKSSVRLVHEALEYERSLRTQTARKS